MGAERRRASRFASQLSVRVLNRQLAVKIAGLELLSSNVSLTGMQLVCPEMRYMSIKKQVNSGRLEAEIELPDSGNLNAICSVAYASEYGDEVLIGINIESFENSHATEWECFISALEARGAG